MTRATIKTNTRNFVKLFLFFLINFSARALFVLPKISIVKLICHSQWKTYLNNVSEFRDGNWFSEFNIFLLITISASSENRQQPKCKEKQFLFFYQICIKFYCQHKKLDPSMQMTLNTIPIGTCVLPNIELHAATASRCDDYVATFGKCYKLHRCQSFIDLKIEWKDNYYITSGQTDTNIPYSIFELYLVKRKS